MEKTKVEVRGLRSDQKLLKKFQAVLDEENLSDIKVLETIWEDNMVRIVIKSTLTGKEGWLKVFGSKLSAELTSARLIGTARDLR